MEPTPTSSAHLFAWTDNRQRSSESCPGMRLGQHRGLATGDSGVRRGRDRRSLNVFGRLKSNLARVEVQTEMNGIAERLDGCVPGHQQGPRRHPRRDIHRALRRRCRRTMFLVMMGAAELRAAHRLRERRQPAAARDRRIAPVRSRCARRSARRAGVSRSCWSRAWCWRSSAAPRLLLAYFGVQAFDAAVPAIPGKPYWIDFRSRLRRVRIRRRDMRADGHPLRPRAGSPRVEDEQQRGPEGRRPRHDRQPPRALAQRDDGRHRAGADGRAARWRRADDPELHEARAARRRIPDRAPDDDADAFCRRGK